LEEPKHNLFAEGRLTVHESSSQKGNLGKKK